MTKEELLEGLIRMAKDKAAGTQGVIILVAQDSEKGVDMTAAVVNIESDKVHVCIDALAKKASDGKSNGLIIVPGKH